MNTITQRPSMPPLHLDNQAHGYVTLISAIIISLISSTIAVSLLLLGLSSSRTSFALVQSKQAASLADACAEEALQQIRSSLTFTGTGSLSLGNGSCSYTVTSQGA